MIVPKVFRSTPIRIKMKKSILQRRNEIIAQNLNELSDVTGYAHQRLADKNVFKKFLNPDPIYLDTRKLEHRLPKNDFTPTISEYKIDIILSSTDKETEASKCNAFYKKISKEIQTESRNITTKAVYPSEKFSESIKISQQIQVLNKQPDKHACAVPPQVIARFPQAIQNQLNPHQFLKK